MPISPNNLETLNDTLITYKRSKTIIVIIIIMHVLGKKASQLRLQPQWRHMVALACICSI